MRLYFQRRTGKTTCVRLVLKLSSCKLSTRTRIEYRSSEKENFLTSPILKPLKLFIYTYIFHKIYTIVQFIRTVKKSIFFKKNFRPPSHFTKIIVQYFFFARQCWHSAFIFCILRNSCRVNISPPPLHDFFVSSRCNSASLLSRGGRRGH